MKNVILISAGILIIALLVTGCKKNNNDNYPTTQNSGDFTEILSDYVDKTVIPTYAEMKDNAKLLFAKAVEFKDSSTQANLNEACELWKAAREPWEASESFLFGPAAYNNLDPLIDSWPLDQYQLEQVLASNQALTADFVRDGLGAVLRGFHTIEYLLFRDGQPRNATDVTSREKEYLTAVTEVLRDDCIKLWALWEGGSAEQTILDELEFEVGTPYSYEFKNAGKSGSRYLSQVDAFDEILQGMIGISDEVANGKIADPHTSGNVLEVESWFSWNSLIDFQNNMRSIENSYLGGYIESTRGKSISEFVKEKNATLDTQVIAKITAAINAIAAIPHPFRNNLTHPNVQVAMDKINELMNTLNSDVRPLIVN